MGYDAVISLEREGKIIKATVEKKAEGPADIIPEVIVETNSGSGSNQSADSNGGASGKTGSTEGRPKREFRLWKRIKSILMNNRMVMLKSNGQQIMDIPILIPVIALIAFFWATLGLALIAMVFGCRFHFEGEDLGKTNINNTMDKATDYAEKVKNDLTGKAHD